MKKLLALVFLLLVGSIAMNVNIENKPVKHSEISPPVTASVTATMYNAVEAQCDASPYVTACNYKINPAKASEHKYVALSRNLLKRWGGQFSYGNKVRITGAGNKNGIYTVADTMNKRYCNHVDILETSGKSWYRYTDVLITKLNC